jgi:hypothetical protein
LFHVETFTGDTNDGIRVLLHVEKLDDFIDVGKLVGTGDIGGLTKDSAEVKSFTDSRGREMQILLLNVASLALEGVVTMLAVDEHLTADDTHGDTGSKHIEKSGFSGARHSHQSPID